MGHPNQDAVVFNDQERNAYFERYYKNCNVYISVYRFAHVEDDGTIDRSSPIIDRVFFDFDDEKWLEHILNLHNWCIENGYIHWQQCSGRGGHFLIFCRSTIVNKSACLYNFQTHVAKKFNIPIDENFEKIRGDTGRLFRYPRSYNFSAGRYCTPIPVRLLDGKYTMEDIYKYASKKQKREQVFSGKKLIDLKSFDRPCIYDFRKSEVKDVDFSIKPDIKSLYPEFPPCVQWWLSWPDLPGKGKYYLIMFLKDYPHRCFPPKKILQILESSLSEDEWLHYSSYRRLRGHSGHGLRKFYSVMKKDHYMLDHCLKIRLHGLCPYPCGRTHPIYEELDI
jgi:hypothetical protein